MSAAGFSDRARTASAPAGLSGRPCTFTGLGFAPQCQSGRRKGAILDSGWLVSYIILWILVIALALVALSHSRLLGVIFQRVGPAPARPLTDKFPESITEIYGVTLLDQPWSRKFPAPRPTVAIFVSPQCQTCNALIPHVKDFVHERGQTVDTVLLSILHDFTMNQAYAQFAELDAIPYIIADRFSEMFPVPVTPYAICLNEGGVVVSKGVVNHYEHLVSLLPNLERKT